MGNKTNKGLVKFALMNLGIPYVMGTACRVLTSANAEQLIRQNPRGWFTLLRRAKVRKWIGQKTTDCHGLIEGYINDDNADYKVTASEGKYDVTADMAFYSATRYGDIKTLPEIPGLCVRYSGHVGIYIGHGYVVEARGYSYGVVVTKLKDRPWTDWYQHKQIEPTQGYVEIKKPIDQQSNRWKIAYMQMMLNVKCGCKLEIDGIWGAKTTAQVKKRFGGTGKSLPVAKLRQLEIG